MNLVKCENGHFYNADKLKSCPHCAGIQADITVKDITGNKQSDIDTFIPDNDMQNTYIQSNKRRLTGWLVCINGNMEGDCFTLYSGENHIGRDTSMDVILFKESTVSRCNHAIITYDDIYARFSLQTDSSTVYVNDKFVEPKHFVTLKSHDIIRLGDCELSFVAFCGKHFQWDYS